MKSKWKPRRLELGLELDQALKCFEKVLKRRRREHDGVTPSANVFGNFQEPAALIFFEVEKEDLSFDGNFFGSNRIGSHSLPTWILVAHIQTITDNSAQTKLWLAMRAAIVGGNVWHAIGRLSISSFFSGYELTNVFLRIPFSTLPGE